MTRWKAAGLHLLASILVILGATAIAVALWYPPSLFHVAGADRLLLVLAVIDVSIGPLLTLLVYRHDKPGMRFDMIVIALLQLSFFSYGAHVFWASRPVFLVGSIDRLELVFANEVEQSDLALARPPYDELGFGRPRLVGLQLPPFGPLRNQLMFEEISGHKAVARPAFYRGYEVVAPRLLQHARKVDAIARVGDESAQRLASTLQRLGRTPDTVRWLPLDSSRGGAVQLVDAASGMPLATLAVDPWEALAASSGD